MVATIVKGKVHIVGAGITSITATDGVSAAISQSLTVSYIAPPTIAISAGNTNVCAGTTVNFSADVTNAGAAAMYQWLVNGLPKGTNNASYSDIFNNGDVVTCMLTPASVCNTPILSNALTIQVNALPTVSFIKSVIGIKQGSAAQLTPAIDGTVATYSWSPVTGLDNAAAEFPTASPTV